MAPKFESIVVSGPAWQLNALVKSRSGEGFRPISSSSVGSAIYVVMERPVENESHEIDLLKYRIRSLAIDLRGIQNSRELDAVIEKLETLSAGGYTAI